MSTPARAAFAKTYGHLATKYLALTRYGFICWKVCYDLDGNEFDSCHEIDVTFDMSKARKFSADFVDLRKALKDLREDREWDGKNYDIVEMFEVLCVPADMNLAALNK